MSKRNLKERIVLSSYDDMFGGNSSEEVKLPAIDGELIQVPLSELHTFENHPFSVLDDEKMEEMVESVKKHGVLVPGLARPRDKGGFEIISGHRRHHASLLAGKDTMPMIIKNCSDDEAVIIMVDANIQREDILPSEKAKAYSMKYNAMKHQGVSGGMTLDSMAEASGENSKMIQRYVWLSRLTDNLLKLVDEKKLGFGQGVDISFLPEEMQCWVYDLIISTKCNISGVQSAQIKELYKNGSLTPVVLADLLKQEKSKERKVVFNSKKLDSYFAPDMSSGDIESLIISLLEEWKRKGGVS